MPFQWSGRALGKSWYWLPVLEACLVLLWIAAPWTPFLGIFADRIVLTALLAFAFVGNLFPLRKRTYAVDSAGLHIRGRPWKNADLPWSSIREIGIPTGAPTPPFPMTQGITRFVAFRGPDGFLLNLINPDQELPAAQRPRFLEALRADARDRGVPMHELPWTEFMAWKPRRHRP